MLLRGPTRRGTLILSKKLAAPDAGRGGREHTAAFDIGCEVNSLVVESDIILARLGRAGACHVERLLQQNGPPEWESKAGWFGCVRLCWRAGPRSPACTEASPAVPRPCRETLCL